jgi:hypothetical protein
MSTTLPALPPTVDTYLSLITSEHNTQPKFMATVAAEVQPFVDLMTTLYNMIGIFNPNASGDQLDKFAVWSGVSRNLPAPIFNVWFSLDDGNLGLDSGTLLGPNDVAANGMNVLPDDSFRILVKLAISMNGWDGTIPGAYTIWNAVFADEGWQIAIQDFQDMTMAFLFLGGVTSAVVQALIVGGYFNLRPAGVRVVGYYEPSVPNIPVFGLDIETNLISGLDVGALAVEFA